jgi:hypothetical protein
VLRQLRNVRIVIGDVGAVLTQELDELQGRRFAQVADVRLVGDAHDVDAAPVDGPLLRVEGARYLLEAEVRHVLVDLPRELHELGVEVELARLPREVEGIDRETVAAEARPRLEAHEAERLRARRLHDLPDVDAHPVAELGELVDQGDVDGAKDVLEQLRQLGCLR